MERGITIEEIDLEKLLRKQCDHLLHRYSEASTEEWPWFETYLTYSNATLPESLLLSYQVTGEDSYLKVGKTTLDFLISQTFGDNMYMPVGQDGWHHRGRKRSHYDQQPEDVTAMVAALRTSKQRTPTD